MQEEERDGVRVVRLVQEEVDLVVVAVVLDGRGEVVDGVDLVLVLLPAGRATTTSAEGPVWGRRRRGR